MLGIARQSAFAAPLLLLLACLAAALAGQGNDQQTTSLYNGGFSVTDIHGKEMALSELAGSVTLIVNVASQCGYTDFNYKGLQEAYAKYHEYGLEVLAFPCNQFGGQEPWGSAEISGFVAERYAASFPLMSKVEVNGPQQHPLFAWLKTNAPAAPGQQQGADIAWNFEKFLIDKRGHVVKRYSSALVQHELEADIYNELVKEEGTDELR